ncbi:MAG: phosphatidate cytidylyltransferase, partial [Bdellovibrionales bacterium]|nr:phosphatidate cytidylyltransferase [Bdellovibrionales bacterium]
GVVVGLVAQVGDLVASLFKRDAGVKDYASSVPGFGGVMDIIDSPLFIETIKIHFKGKSLCHVLFLSSSYRVGMSSLLVIFSMARIMRVHIHNFVDPFSGIRMFFGISLYKKEH